MHQLDVTTPTDTQVRMTRAFDAPRSLVWRAYTDPDLIPRWMTGPDGHTMPVCEVDFREGGKWRHVWATPQGNEMAAQGEYLAIRPQTLIRNTEIFDEWPDNPTHVTTEFHEANGVTTVVQTVDYDSRATRDQVLQTGMEIGVAAGMDRLDDLLAAVA